MIEITYYGHSCFQVRTDVRILFDPFISQNPLASFVRLSDLHPDYLLLTHGHGDHVADVMEFADQPQIKGLVAIYEIATWFENKSFPGTHGLNFGGTYCFTGDTSAKLVQAQHSSSLPDGSYGGQAGSFILKSNGKTLFVAGDTALHSDMQLFGEYEHFDLAILPIGGTYTLDVHDAIRAARFLQCSHVVGCHYDTFPAIQIDKPAAIRAFKEAGIILHLLKVGDKIGI